MLRARKVRFQSGGRFTGGRGWPYSHLAATFEHCMRKIHFIRTALLSCLLLFSASFGAAEDIKKIHPTGYVSDLAAVLSADAKTRLEALCSQVDQQPAPQLPILTIHP